MTINKKEVRTSNDLQQYLQESAKKSDRLYHYTTFESLICIIRNKCFRLSRMDLLNDRAEIKLGNKDRHLQYYIMSLTRDKEYISMWAMYGKPSGIKLRLDFDRDKFANAINNNFYFDSGLENRIPLMDAPKTNLFAKKDFLISDIVYLDKSSMALRHNENAFPMIGADDHIINEMTGFIKYDAWEFEREVRLRTRLQGYDLDNSNHGNTPRYIFAGINETLISDFGITFNPWISSELKEEIKKSLNALTGCELKYADSQNDGEVTEL